MAMILAALLSASACRQEMYDQAKYKPLGESRFFPDSRAARSLPEGTVARGWLRSDQRLYQGRQGHDLVTTGPYKLVRHPIYTAMLGKLIATGIVLSVWPVLLASVAIFLIGTLIRIRFEEKLLSGAFGEKFAEWRSRVPGLIPFVKV